MDKEPKKFWSFIGGHMSRSFVRGAFCSVLALFTILLGMSAKPAWAQNGTTGTVVITVLDPDGKAVPGAQLTLQDLSTNDTRTAATQDRGTYSFVNLSLGTYKLTVTKAGFNPESFDSIAVHAAQETDVTATMKIGVATETVEVHESETPLIEASSNTISTNIDLKQIEDLPLGGRDLGGLSTLVPGTANSEAGPTWNGLPVMAQGGNIDGVVGNTNRMKFAGNGAEPAVSPRIEDISEMTVQTGQLDVNQGFGQSVMELNFVTRRGSNSFHGRAFEDFQNSYLNANSWVNDNVGSVKNHYELNDFGGSVGGPILKNKLFFFGTFAESKQPGSITATQNYLTPGAQQGIFSYPLTGGGNGTACLFTTGTCTGIVNQYNAANGTSFPTAVNSTIAAEQNNINTAALPLGQTSSTGDPNINSLRWELASPATTYFPTVRVDYNMSQNMRFNIAWNETNYSQPNVNPPQFPGAPFDGQGSGNFLKYYTAGFGFDWTIKPTLVNQFRGGFLYYDQGYGDLGFTNIETQYPVVNWAVNAASGQNYDLPTPDYYPTFSASDTMTWQHGAHTLNFGFSWYREQDHYWNAPAGFANYGLGLSNGDPALNMFSTANLPNVNPNNSNSSLNEIENLYATLAGDINFVGGSFAYLPKTGAYSTTNCSPCRAYNLDERSGAFGLFIQDSFRLKSNLTVNYGLRWDFTGANQDLTGAYHSVTEADLYGPSGEGNLFNPGSLQGTNNPLYQAIPKPYKSWDVSPQPQIGIAWSPQYSDGILGKLAGGGQMVVRAGFQLRNSIQPYQYMWDYATDQGQFYYQQWSLNPGTSGAPGTFAPGALTLNGTGNSQLPNITAIYPLLSSPATYQTTAPMSQYTFLNFNSNDPNTAWGFNPNIKQPYTESWNLGIQRQIGKSNALEIRYVGSRTVHQWLGLDTNEVNIFQNNGPGPSFLNQFQQAQANLKINTAHGYTGAGSGANPQTFADLGFPGEAPTPIFDAAFAGEPVTNGAAADYSNVGTFIQPLITGQAGLVAGTLSSGTPVDYFCNLVGASFTPCATNLGYTGPGAGYPINYFQANPYEAGGSTFVNTSGGYSTYNALQVDFRQKQWHGMQFDVNYTWAHNLGLSTMNDWEGLLDNAETLRDLHLSYAPTLYDLRNTININGTYDLPFGKGKAFLNHGGALDRIVGGWTVGTIFTFNSGSPFELTGEYQTYNFAHNYNLGDGGVDLTGISRSQLQSAVGVFEQATANNPVTPVFNPSILSSVNGGANGNLLSPNTSPGTLQPQIWLHGPHFFNDDLAITKSVAIRENVRFSLQGEFLNAFNHPNFGTPDAGVQDSGFGTDYGPITSYANNGARAIELRANLSF
jgi:hypothetical protein